jgi:hypothetical protein
MSDAYAEYLEKEYAEAARKAHELLMANQLAQLKAGSPATKEAAAPYLKLPELELPSTAPELRKALEAAIANYRKTIENARSFETKLREAGRAEAAAVTDDGADERKIVKAVAEAQGLQAVYSRRAELAKQKVPEAFVVILPLAKALAQDLVNRCVRLVQERANAHREVFRPRLDQETFIRTLPSGFPVDFETSLDRLVACCPDVVNARACIPQFSFLGRSAMPADLTSEKLTWDLNTLKTAEEAFEVEAAREYNFEAPAEVETEPQPVEA